MNKIIKTIKIIIICMTCFLTSCSLDDDGTTNFNFELVRIESVDIPDEFTQGETHEITVSYFRPTDCHSFSGFSYDDSSSNERILSVQNVVINDRLCEDLGETELIEESIDFEVGIESSYIFKFWQSINDQGENQFLVVEVPVVE